MKFLRPLAGYTLYDHKKNQLHHRELRITGIPDKIDEYRRNWFLHLQRMPQNRIPFKSYRYRPQGRRTIGRPKKRWRERSSCNCGDGTYQRVQSLMFMMMVMMTTTTTTMMMMMMFKNLRVPWEVDEFLMSSANVSLSKILLLGFISALILSSQFLSLRNL